MKDSKQSRAEALNRVARRIPFGTTPEAFALLNKREAAAILLLHEPLYKLCINWPNDKIKNVKSAKKTRINIHASMRSAFGGDEVRRWPGSSGESPVGSHQCWSQPGVIRKVDQGMRTLKKLRKEKMIQIQEFACNDIVIAKSARELQLFESFLEVLLELQRTARTSRISEPLEPGERK